MLSTDQNLHILTFDYAFTPIDDIKYEPYFASEYRQMAMLASRHNSINIKILYEQSELERP